MDEDTFPNINSHLMCGSHQLFLFPFFTCLSFWNSPLLNDAICSFKKYNKLNNNNNNKNPCQLI